MIRRAALVLTALAVVVGGYFAGRELVRRPDPAPATAVAPSSPIASQGRGAPDTGLAPDGPAADRAPVGDGRVSRRERRQQRLGDRSMALEEAIRDHASGPWVEGRGTVVRVLRDDLRGRQHQRFVLKLGSGGTLLVAHNTQLAGRVPVEEGEEVGFRGRYEWGARGGIVHWTHRDPRGGSGGWLEVAGRRYD
jgi:hypothetical protein